MLHTVQLDLYEVCSLIQHHDLYSVADCNCIDALNLLSVLSDNIVH
jgi:hypothetical protein